MNCVHVFPEGSKCSSDVWEHVHQPVPCANGKPERHHDFKPEPPHKHRYDRCVCGVQRKVAS